MSNAAINEYTEAPELERGTRSVVARDHRGGSGDHIGSRAEHLAEAGVLERARAVGRAMPVGEPSVPATFKIPRNVLTRLRTYSASSGLTLSPMSLTPRKSV
jgi:hypothetical protein